MNAIRRIVSGGQTGADRAALDWAIKHRIPHGGWCPKGRLAEDGRIDSKYNLRETPTSNYRQRTEWNARDSDGTVVFSIAPVLTGGSRTTIVFAQKHRKPVIHISLAATANPGIAIREFVVRNGIRILNVAGPRASNEPQVAKFTKKTLDRLLSKVAGLSTKSI